MGYAKDERELVVMRLGCLGKAADDEPVFIIRAQDKFAAAVVNVWANLVDSEISSGGDSNQIERSQKKVKQARELVREIQIWQAANPTKVPD